MPDARRRRDATRLAMVCGFALAASMALPATAYALSPTGLSVPSASARPTELSQARPLTLSAALRPYGPPADGPAPCCGSPTK